MLEFFCRHLIGLGVTYRHKNAEDASMPARFSVSSGTLISIHGLICFLTAGHVLKALDKLRTHDQVEVESASLVDTLGWKRVSNVPIPFDLKNARLFYIDDVEDGLDFGVIMLEAHHVGLLAKNGVIALGEENWNRQHTVRFDGFAMLGFPEEYTSQRVSASGDGTVSPVMFGIKRLEAPPSDRASTRYPQFVAQINPELPLKSVEGMSGGPIFGFRQDGEELRYWVVALQSSWDRQRRITYGCDLPLLASLMTEWAGDSVSA
ncbi:hypothetical protein [Bradyrhizobium sp. CCBAU 45394]|uniref:hypothetical protein n=1 Tax=Bradyrhizobium sp. CCBAU 45394 TaxID=1325087 RepID=UPI002304480B|nr:hypothetical protein [Bradyrhizobium sp. CCBAU 45394]